MSTTLCSQIEFDNIRGPLEQLLTRKIDSLRRKLDYLHPPGERRRRRDRRHRGSSCAAVAPRSFPEWSTKSREGSRPQEFSCAPPLCHGHYAVRPMSLLSFPSIPPHHERPEALPYLRNSIGENPFPYSFALSDPK